jgi:antirestriction protein ArdC
MPPSPGQELPKPGRPVKAGGCKKKVTMKDAVYQVITDRVTNCFTSTRNSSLASALAHQAPSTSKTNQQESISWVNVFLLNSMSYTSPYWLTFKQAQELGGNVRKGEKACPVVFWKWLEVEKDGKADKVPMLR